MKEKKCGRSPITYIDVMPIAHGTANPVMAGSGRKAEQATLHKTIGLDALLATERATVEK